MRPDLFTIARSGPGCLSIMTRPRGGDWLQAELSDLALAGATVLVSLLTDAEAAELDLGHEADAAGIAGTEGIGRSATLAALGLVLEGMNPGEAWTRIAAARGLPVPDTSAQRAFIGALLPID